MQEGQACLVDQVQGRLEHRLVLGWEAGDQIGAEDEVRAQAAQAASQADRLVPQMPALHPLEHKVVARLDRQVQVRQ